MHFWHSLILIISLIIIPPKMHKTSTDKFLSMQYFYFVSVEIVNGQHVIDFSPGPLIFTEILTWNRSNILSSLSRNT